MMTVNFACENTISRFLPFSIFNGCHRYTSIKMTVFCCFIIIVLSGRGGISLTSFNNSTLYFYRAMHFSAKHGIAIACRLSVRLSVCNVVDCDHIGWNTSVIISPLVSLGCSLSRPKHHHGSTPRGTPQNLGPKRPTPC